MDFLDEIWCPEICPPQVGALHVEHDGGVRPPGRDPSPAPWQRHRTALRLSSQRASQRPPPSRTPRAMRCPVTHPSTITIAPNIAQYFQEVISDAIRVRHVDAT